MRYKSIELYNYAGIYNGMGLTQIKIDFTKCMTNKIIIKGKNGSGKSTLLNAINPNPDDNDSFIPNHEARKTIILTENNIDYIIRYIHPVTNSGRGVTKGYISKTINGQIVELNPNGNISSCKEIIYNEFNLDSNYLALSKLTSENRGLVDSKPAVRKKLVNSIIYTLETYNNIFKILSKKSSSLKSLINSLTYKIDYIGNETQLITKLQSIENKINVLEEEKNTTIEAIAAVKIKISEYIDILKENNYDGIVEELSDLSSFIKTITNNINIQLKKYNINNINLIKPFMDDIDRQIINLEAAKNEIMTRNPILLAEKESEFKNLQIKQEKLNSLQSDYNYIDLKKAIKQSKQILNECIDVFNKMKLSNINIITKTEFDYAMQALKYLKECAVNLTSSYNIENIKFVVENRGIVSNNISELHSIKLKIDNYKNKYNDLNNKYNIFIAKREIAKELVNRPSGCMIDDCPYIKTAFNADKEYPENKLIEIKNEMDMLCDDINYNISLVDKYELYSEILMNIVNIERELNSKMIFISKLPVRNDFTQTFITRMINLDNFYDIDELYAFVDCGNMIEKYKITSDQLYKYETEYRVYESKNDIIESIINDIKILTDKTDKLTSDIINNNNKLSEIDNSLLSLNDIRNKINVLYDKINGSLIPSQERQKELISIKNKLDNNTSEISTLQNNLDELNSNINNVVSNIKALSNDRDSIKHSLIMLSEYKTEMIKYRDEYNKIEKIKYYSSSSTGIQTLYMSLYMNKILSTANNLLSLLFDGEFMLQPFIINEKEFRIPCLGNGLIHDDISSMSTAQKSMISMIISYAILNQSETKYNIISLDEMDGSLDGSNRSYFMTLLDSLMNILRCEQCFIISHNSELTSEIADLIILKDDINISHKGNIIWQY